MELVEMTFLLKKEEMTPRLGGSIDMYSFMDNHFSVRKMVQDEQFPFKFGKWIEFSNGQTFSSSENGPVC
jgi:hypothetical protein